MPELAFSRDGLSALFNKPVAGTNLHKALSGLGIGIVEENDSILKLQVPENRPDLFMDIGISRAVKRFLGLEKPNAAEFEASASGVEVSLSSGVSSLWPHLSCAVVSGLSLEMENIESLSRFGDALCKWALRTGSSSYISFHDLSKTTPPFTYEAVEANSVKPFSPAGRYKEMTLSAILEEANDKRKGKRDVSYPIGSGSRVACFSDSIENVIAIPPLAENGEFALREDTTDVLVLSTGLSRIWADRVLAAAASSLAWMGGALGQVMIASSGSLMVTPSVEPLTVETSLSLVCGMIGNALEPEQVITALSRMGLPNAAVDAKNDRLSVSIPYFRADVTDPSDVAAALLSGLGYAFVKPDMPERTLFGRTSDSTRTSFRLRDVLVGHGFTETVSPLPLADGPPRNDILQGLFLLLSGSRDSAIPQKVFELGPVDSPGTRKTHLAGVLLDVAESGFFSVKSVVSSLLAAADAGWKVAPYGGNFYIPGRCAEIIVSSRDGAMAIGHFGEVHPQVLEAHALHYPAAAFEVDLSRL